MVNAVSYRCEAKRWRQDDNWVVQRRIHTAACGGKRPRRTSHSAEQFLSQSEPHTVIRRGWGQNGSANQRSASGGDSQTQATGRKLRNTPEWYQYFSCNLFYLSYLAIVEPPFLPLYVLAAPLHSKLKCFLTHDWICSTWNLFVLFDVYLCPFCFY